MEAFKDGAWRTPVNVEAYIGGKWRTLRYAEAYISGAWRSIASFVQPLVLSISPSPNTVAEHAFTMTTGNTTATPAGGLGPFTYAWTLVSSIGLSGITINSPSSATTTFTASVIGPAGNSGSALFRCTVTDSLGSTDTETVEVDFEHTAGS